MACSWISKTVCCHPTLAEKRKNLSDKPRALGLEKRVRHSQSDIRGKLSHRIADPFLFGDDLLLVKPLACSPKTPPNLGRVRRLKKETGDEGNQVQRGTDNRGAARAGGRGQDRRGVPAPRDLKRDLLQVEGEVRGTRGLRRQAAEGDG